MRSKTTIPFLISLSILLLAAAATGAPVLSPPPSPCSPSLLANASRHIPFDTSSLLCSDVWAPEGFVLMFQHSKDYRTWSYVLSVPKNDCYFAVGFSKDGAMKGSVAMVGWVAADGKGTGKQYFLGGKTADTVNPDMGDLDLVKGKTAMFAQSSRMYLAFELNTTANQPMNHLIYAIGESGMLPGSNHTLSYHRDRISTTITYVPENTEPPEPSPSPSRRKSPPESSSDSTKGPPNSNSGGKPKSGKLRTALAASWAVVLALSCL